MSTLEVIIFLVVYTALVFVFVYFYINSKVSLFRLEKINDYLNAREREFFEKFQVSLKEFREAGINLQHDFIRFDRLRDGMEVGFRTLEQKLSEVNQHSQDMGKTTAFYQELQNIFKENNLKLQEFISKLNTFENDFQNKEKSLKDLDKIITDFKENFNQKVQILETDFTAQLLEVEKNIQQGYERVINLSKVSSDKLKQQYAELEADFKDSIDNLAKEEKENLQQGIQEIRSNSEIEIVSLQANLRKQEDQIINLMERYSDWEKEIADHRQHAQENINRFSESILSGLKEKIDDYQKEILDLLEKRYKKLNQQTNEIESRNQLKHGTLEALQNFIEESKKSITYQINNLSDFLEEQKHIQNALYQKNRLVLVDAYNDLREEFISLQGDIHTINKNRKTILEEIHQYLDKQFPLSLSKYVPRVLQEVFVEGKRSSAGSEDFRNRLKGYFENRLKEMLRENLGWVMRGIREDPNWPVFLEEEARLKLVDKLNVDKFKKQYEELEKKFRSKVELLVEKELEKILEKWNGVRGESEERMEVLEANLKEQENRVAILIDRYQEWEKEIGDQRQSIEGNVDRLSEELLEEVKKKVMAYQEEMMANIEQRWNGFQGESEEKKTVLEANLKEQENRVAVLVDRYREWEKEIGDQRQSIEGNVDRLSEELLEEVKKKVMAYQEEMMANIETKLQQMEKWGIDVEEKNRLKEEALDTLQNFVEESRSTITYQISNLSDFLENQKRIQGELVDKDHEEVNKKFNQLKNELDKLQVDLYEHKKNRNNFLKDISEYMEIRLQQALEIETHRILREVFNENFQKKLRPDHKRFLKDIDQYFTKKIRETTDIQKFWLIDMLKKDADWQSFLEEQSRINLLNNLKTEKVLNELKKNFSKEFLREELHKDMKDYRKEIEDIDKDWKKISEEIVQQKKSLNQFLLQGEDKLENLVEGIKLNLADKEQTFQDLFNIKIIGMEKKMNEVSERIDFFLDKAKSVDKIFLFQKEFSETMADYQKQFNDLKKNEKRFIVFKENLNKLEQESERLQSIHQNLMEKESNVLEISQQLEKIMGMTSEIQDHIATVNKQSLDIDKFLVQLQGYNQDISKVKREFENIKKIQEDFQEVSNWIADIRSQSQQNEEKTELFLNRVTAGEDLQKKVSDQIKSLEEKSLGLDERYKAIEYFNKKFDEFDMAVYDVEKRIETIQSLKKEMAVEQENLNLLKEGFNEQISIILKIFQNQRGQDSNLFTELDKKFKSLPQTLSHLGWSDKEIAKHLDLELYEVQLLLNRKKRKR